jgi:bifunctional ADP-heptose synthase (sugar kinase/adenylyltransferase)
LEIDAERSELSLETGLEAHQVTCVRNQPGALGTVLSNLAALGRGNLVPVTVIGDDGHGYDLLQALESAACGHFARDPLADRLTPTYTKPLRRDASGAWQELNRLDVRSREPLTAELCDQLCQHLQAAFARADGLIVLDQIDQYNTGVIHDRVRDCLRELSLESSGPVDLRRQPPMAAAVRLRHAQGQPWGNPGRREWHDRRADRRASTECPNRPPGVLYLRG